ncbi:hypothetical protein B0H12DRAFT_713403 [Mycena haematopus]|nr:hypothetical protein B0H12DRAFT_713403 [Mycena haematopus]
MTTRFMLRLGSTNSTYDLHNYYGRHNYYDPNNYCGPHNYYDPHNYSQPHYILGCFLIPERCRARERAEFGAGPEEKSVGRVNIAGWAAFCISSEPLQRKMRLGECSIEARRV